MPQLLIAEEEWQQQARSRAYIRAAWTDRPVGGSVHEDGLTVGKTYH